MELITTYRFKAGLSYVGIVGRKDPLMMYTTNEHSAVHHSKDEFYWVCDILDKANLNYTFEEFNHLYSPEKFYSR